MFESGVDGARSDVPETHSMGDSKEVQVNRVQVDQTHIEKIKRYRPRILLMISLLRIVTKKLIWDSENNIYK